MKTIKTLVIVMAMMVGTALAYGYIRASGWGYSTDPAEAVAEAVAKAQAGLYDQCPSGRVTHVRISTSTTVGGSYVSVDAEATGFCEGE